MAQPSDLSDLPTPIAVPLSEHLASRNSLLKLWTSIDVIEMTMRLATVIAIKWIKERDGALPSGLAATLRRGLDRPGFGAWRQIVEESAANLQDQPPPVFPELGPVLASATQPLFPARAAEHDIARSLVDLRNHLAHRGATTSAQADGLWQHWEARFHRSFEEIMAFEQICLVGVHASGKLYHLTGISPVPIDPEALQCPVPHDGPQDAVYALSSGACLSLWPILAYGPPALAAGANTGEQDEHHQVYFRRGETRLYYAVMGDSAIPMSFQGDEALSALTALLITGEPDQPAEFQVADFDRERQRHLQHFRGREEFQAELVTCVREADRPIWITGDMGIGKSASAAQLYQDLSAGPDDEIVLHYMFKRGDERCSRWQFLRYLGERLARELGQQEKYRLSSFELPTVQSLVLQFVERGRTLVLILDGMDELEAVDEDFIDKIALRPDWRGVQWVLAGREQGRLLGLSEKKEILKRVVRPLAEDDVHSFFFEEIGRQKNALLEHYSQAELDHLIELLTKRSGGLPLYIHHVIWDLRSGKLRLFDLAKSLPRSLRGYYRRFLNDMGIGRVGQLATSMASLLAVAHQPFSREVLADLFASRDEVFEAGEFDQALLTLEPVLHGSPTVDGTNRFELHHHSFREYLSDPEAELGSDLENMRRTICKAFLVVDEAETAALRDYLLRYGVKHLLEIRKLRVTGGRKETDSAAVALQSLEDPALRARRRALLDPVSLIDDVRGLESRLAGAAWERLVQVLLAMAADEAKADHSMIDPEWIHAELVYRESKDLYARFLDAAAVRENWITQGLDEQNAARWQFVFRARRANAWRRKGKLDPAEAEFRECETFFRESSPPDFVELARVEYDRGYVALLRGRINEAYQLFMASAETAAQGNDPVGAAIGRVVAAANGWLYGMIDTGEAAGIAEQAREEFLRSAATHPSAGRWVTNANSHLLQVAAYEGDEEAADALLNQLQNDPWIARTDYAAILERAKILHALAHRRFEEAIDLIPPPTTDLATIKDDRREGQARTYFELCYCHAKLGNLEASTHYGELGLAFPEDAGDGAYQQRIREVLDNMV